MLMYRSLRLVEGYSELKLTEGSNVRSEILVGRLALPSDYFVLNSIVAIIIFIQGTSFV